VNYIPHFRIREQVLDFRDERTKLLVAPKLCYLRATNINMPNGEHCCQIRLQNSRVVYWVYSHRSSVLIPS